jgi:hypothetical protein
MNKEIENIIKRRKILDPDFADEIWCYRVQPYGTLIKANEFGKLEQELECSITLKDAKIWWLDAWYGGVPVDVWEFKTHQFEVVKGSVEIALGIMKDMKWVKIKGFTIAKLIDVWRYENADNIIC